MRNIDGFIKIIADSVNTSGNRLTTFQISFPKCLLAELNTHRVLSKNCGSSRAKPSRVLRKAIREKSFQPSSWDMNEPGMQSTEPLPLVNELVAKFAWYLHKEVSIFCNWLAGDVAKLHKQYANRLLESHAYVDVVLSGTEWKNFFMLRTHKDAQPEFREIARIMERLYKWNEPILLEPGEWHLPYVEKSLQNEKFLDKDELELLKKYSIARCARVSYKTFDGDENPDKDLQLCEKLFGATPMHLSPTEHVAMALDNSQRCGNFVGFKQYRQTISNESGGDYEKA